MQGKLQSIGASHPRVSVGLPVYNGEDYIQQTIQSILDQSFADIELIVCDNASTDGTGSIVREFAGRDARVRYIRQHSNLGAAKNYNRAFFEARGEYFKWASHDDCLSRNFLQRCVDEMDADPELFLAHCATVIIDEEDRETSCYLDCLESDSADPVTRFSVWMEQIRGQCNPVFGLVRRAEMAKTGLHGTYIGADRVLLGEFALRGRSKTIRDAFFFRRIHKNISTEANPNALDLTRWFNGKKNFGPRFKRWRQLREFVRMIFHVPISVKDRVRASGVLLRWAFRLRSEFLKELMLPLYINGEDTRLKAWMRRRKAARQSKRAAS